MKIGLLQCGAMRDALTRAHGDYPRLYADLLGPGFDWSVHRCFEGDIPDDPGQCDGWLVSGSRHGAYEPHDWIPPLEDFLRRVHGRAPLVGICFGHQIVAQALGGRVENFAGGWSVGRQAYEWEGEIVHLNAWHQDQVTRPPEGAVTLARNDFTRHAAFRIGARTLTLQPHPEFSAACIADMIPLVGRGTVPEERLASAEAALSLPLDDEATGRRLARFLRQEEA